jgi:hypothetical protein
MKRYPIAATVSAIALFIASISAVPAQAGKSEDNLLGLMLGIGALAIIADKAHDNKKRRATVSQPEGYHSHDGSAAHRHRNSDRLYGYDWNESTFRRDRKDRRKFLRRKMYHGHEAPKTCLRQRWTENGWKTYTSKPCVKKYAAKHHFHDKKQTNHIHDKRGRVVTKKELRARRDY